MRSEGWGQASSTGGRFPRQGAVCAGPHPVSCSRPLSGQDLDGKRNALVALGLAVDLLLMMLEVHMAVTGARRPAWQAVPGAHLPLHLSTSEGKPLFRVGMPLASGHTSGRQRQPWQGVGLPKGVRGCAAGAAHEGDRGRPGGGEQPSRQLLYGPLPGSPTASFRPPLQACLG